MRGRARGPGRLHKRGGMWTLDWTTSEGVRERVGLSSNRREAEEIRAAMIRRRDLTVAGLGAEAGQEATVAEILRAYLADLEPRVTARHFQNMRLRLEKTIQKLANIRVAEFKPMHAVRLRAEAVHAGKSNRTANLIVTTLQAAFRWAVENELVGRSPIDRIKRLPETEEHRKYRRRALSDEEIQRFLEAAAQDDADCAAHWPWVRVPQLVLWQTLLTTGCRWGELRLAVWGDLDLREGTLILRAQNTKSRKARAIPLNTSLAGDLRRLKAHHERVHGRLPTIQDRVFLSPEGRPWPWHTTNTMRILDRVLDRAGIAKVNAMGEKLDVHALRHSAASRMLRSGVSLVHAQRILGHADPRTTSKVYVHLGVEDLRAAVDAMGAVEHPQPRQETAL